jgi:hypothetical protein
VVVLSVVQLLVVLLVAYTLVKALLVMAYTLVKAL